MLKRCAIASLTISMIGSIVVPVSAQPTKKRVMLVPLQRGDTVSSVVPGRVYEAFKNILENNRTLEIVDPRVLKAAPKVVKRVAPVVDKYLKKADKALSDAKDLMRKEKYRGAVAKFKSAMANYEKRFAQLVDFDKYVDAALGVALAWYYAGIDDNGEDALAPVLILRPETVLDKRRTPKAALEALSRLRNIYSKSPGGRLHIKSQPQGAMVYVDGIRRGEAPVYVSDLWRGRHVIRVVKEGFQPESRRLTIGSRQMTLQMNLKPVKRTKEKKSPVNVAKQGLEAQELLIQTAKTGKMGRAFRKLAKKMAKAHTLDAIVMSYVRKSGRSKYEMAVFVYAGAVNHIAELEWVSFATDLADAQPKMLVLEERILGSLAFFPRSRILAKGKKSKIYKPVVEKPKPAPVVVKKPRKLPKVAVIKPKPRKKPVRVKVPPRVRKKPRAVTPKPRPAPRRVVRPTPIPVVRPTPIPVVRPTPAPVVRPVPAPVVRPVPAPVVRPVPAPVVRPIPVRPVPAPVAPTPSRGGVVPAPAPVWGGGSTGGPVPVIGPPVVQPVPVLRIPTAPAPIVVNPTPLIRPTSPVLIPTQPTPAPVTGSLHLLRPGGIHSPGPKWYKTWWFWTIVGSVTVVTTTGLILGLSGGGTPGFRATVNWGQ